MLPIVC